MKLIAHRGCWRETGEKNSRQAFLRALEYGYGIETDFRDLNGQLVISHDIPMTGAMAAAEFAELCRAYPVESTFALNVKSDGLHSLIEQFIESAGLKRYFVFDMSIPDARGYLRNSIPVFTRMSEWEPFPAFLSLSAGVWLDAFESEWYSIELIEELISQNKSVAIVSPELHHREHLNLWKTLRAHRIHKHPLISLCTDFPMQAKEFFCD